jgi:Domain of unknown function (DUF6766)
MHMSEPTAPSVLKKSGLTIVYVALFLVTLVIMAATGHNQYNADRRDHGEAAVDLPTYLRSGDFIEGVFENWESEFLQMGTYVVFTVFLFQVGSSESKDPAERAPQDVDPRKQRYPSPPWPVRRGGVILKLYMNSLVTAMAILFVASFLLHAVGGTWAYNEEQLAHGGATVGVLGFVGTSAFWFQSMQNWQSEFLSVACLAVFSIYLRQHGSPESKPVAAPHSQTGG